MASDSAEAAKREEERHVELLKAVDELTIEPPLPRYPYSLARLHASIIRRMQSANDRMLIGPIERIHPKRFEIIIDLNLTHRGGRAEARKWVIENIDEAKKRAGVRDGGQGILWQKDQPSSQYLFARLEARAISALVQLDIDTATTEAKKLSAATDNVALKKQIDAPSLRAIVVITSPDACASGESTRVTIRRTPDGRDEAMRLLDQLCDALLEPRP